MQHYFNTNLQFNIALSLMLYVHPLFHLRLVKPNCVGILSHNIYFDVFSSRPVQSDVHSDCPQTTLTDTAAMFFVAFNPIVL